MSKIINYTASLEELITTLLPIYDDYCRRYPFSPLIKEIDRDVVKRLKHTKDCGALLRPQKNHS